MKIGNVCGRKPQLQGSSPNCSRPVTFLAAVVMLVVGTTAHADSMPCLMSSYGGVKLDGQECIPVARALAEKILGRSFPRVGADNGPTTLWKMDADLAKAGWKKVVNDGKAVPSMSRGGVLLIWGTAVHPVGHIALVIGVDTQNRRAWVVEGNFVALRGSLRLVDLDSKVVGWLMPN